MSKKLKVLKLREGESKKESRLILEESEWVVVKEAVDNVRIDNEDEESRRVLQQNDLWDYQYDCPDEDKILFLFYRNA